MHPGLEQLPMLSSVLPHHVPVWTENSFHFLLQQLLQLYQGAVLPRTARNTFSAQTPLLTCQVNKYVTINTPTTEVHSQCIWEASQGAPHRLLYIISVCVPMRFHISEPAWMYRLRCAGCKHPRSRSIPHSLSKPLTANADITPIYLLFSLYVHTYTQIFYTHIYTHTHTSLSPWHKQKGIV